MASSEGPGRLLVGDCRDILPALGERVQCVVTSAPYWGLRSYLPVGHPMKPREIGQERVMDCLGWARGESCGACYICTLRYVFALVRAKLADDGVMWLNHGDCYHNTDKGGYQPTRLKAEDSMQRTNLASDIRGGGANRQRQPGLKNKDICGQPWRLALALQADGWYWRDEIIWHKRNSMPSSQRDRTTRAHETVLMFATSERYYYDADAIKEPASPDTHARYARAHTRIDTPGQPRHNRVAGDRPNGHTKPVAGWAYDGGSHSAIEHAQAKDRDGRKLLTVPVPSPELERPRKAVPNGAHGAVKNNTSMDAALHDVPLVRLKRSVWDIPARGYKDAHFATFPPELIEPMILAGSRPGDVVLDPFMGSGTVAEVAERLGRRWIGIDIDPRNEPMLRDRTRQPSLEIHG